MVVTKWLQYMYATGLFQMDLKHSTEMQIYMQVHLQWVQLIKCAIHVQWLYSISKKGSIETIQ